jgi:hypothetical protein
MARPGTAQTLLLFMPRIRRRATDRKIESEGSMKDIGANVRSRENLS